LTVDLNVMLPADLNPRDWPAGPGKSRLANLAPDELAAAGSVGVETDTSIGFDSVGWLREVSGLPVLVKGVLRADDARFAIDAGAAGVVVSTHGGRRMGSSVSSAYALAEVATAVGDQGEVYVDSGLRSGEHVAAALALGARAVFIGRPALWALAADGERGVEVVVEGLSRDLAQTMTQLGAASLDQLTPDLLAPDPAAPPSPWPGETG
jgi:4-hydroxymandelate oxidase